MTGCEQLCTKQECNELREEIRSLRAWVESVVCYKESCESLERRIDELETEIKGLRDWVSVTFCEKSKCESLEDQLTTIRNDLSEHETKSIPDAHRFNDSYLCTKDECEEIRQWASDTFCEDSTCAFLQTQIVALGVLFAILQDLIFSHMRDPIPDAHSFDDSYLCTKDECDSIRDLIEDHKRDPIPNAHRYSPDVIVLVECFDTGIVVTVSVDGFSGSDGCVLDIPVVDGFCTVEKCQELKLLIEQVQIDLSNHKSSPVPDAHRFDCGVDVDVSLASSSEGLLRLFTRVDVCGQSGNDSAEIYLSFPIPNLDDYCTKNECEGLQDQIDDIRNDLNQIGDNVDQSNQDRQQDRNSIEGILNGSAPIPIVFSDGETSPSNNVPRSAVGGGISLDELIQVFCTKEECQAIQDNLMIVHSVELLLNGDTLICTVFINGQPQQGSVELMRCDLTTVEQTTSNIFNEIINSVIPKASAAETKAIEASAAAAESKEKSQSVLDLINQIFSNNSLSFNFGVCGEVYSTDNRLIGAQYALNPTATPITAKQLLEALRFVNDNINRTHEDVCKVMNFSAKIWGISGGNEVWGNNLEVSDYNPQSTLKYYHDLLYNLDTNPNGEETITARNNKDIFAALMAIMQHQLGLHNFPERVPIKLSDNDPTNLNTFIDIDNLVDLNLWYYRQFDELVGRFPFEIEVLDNDWTTLGDDGQTVFKVPNIAEALAEITFKQIQQDAAINYQNALIQRCLLETISAKLVTTKNFYKLETVQDWIGMKLKQVKKRVRFTCNPLIDIPSDATTENDFTVAKFFAPKEIEVECEEFDEDNNFQRDLFFIMRAVTIIQSTFTDQMPLTDDAGDSLIQKIKAMDDILKNRDPDNPDGETDEFLDFLQKVEDMFGSTFPYGKPRDNRPRLRKLDGDNPTVS